MADDYNEFRRRWNIPFPNEKEVFSKFKIGVTNILEYNLKTIYNPVLNSLFCGRALVRDSSPSIYGVSNIYYAISSSESLPDILFYLEIIINILKEASRNSRLRKLEHGSIKFKRAIKSIINEVKRLIKILSVSIVLKEERKSILFYPSGANLLDERLVNDTLDWLSEYPKAHKNFKTALDKYQKKIYKRNLVDDLRSSLEMFLKEYLGNKKSLENQKSELLKKLKDLGVSAEVRNLFWVILDKYSKYHNENVKHNDNVREEEIELMIYQTGMFIRFLIVLKKE